ncbi:hypothetical protein [Nocardia vermiculata]|uniref:MarR family transcriptional regulator n=1 Tax=Nocardia vermiculata TaxID=257274 RepID=A0A846Y4R1_9NOCA|nr:hypothetical protein [Nocardia vermiculata]NKY54213.1 hypothetical protein [Nocardia vermiculata]
MNNAERIILATLAPGGILTTTQIQRSTTLPGWTTRHALARLHARGLIAATHHHSRWRLTARGGARPPTPR